MQNLRTRLKPLTLLCSAQSCCSYYQAKCVCSPSSWVAAERPFISQNRPVSPLASLEAITTDSTTSYGPILFHKKNVKRHAGSSECKVGERRVSPGRQSWEKRKRKRENRSQHTESSHGEKSRAKQLRKRQPVCVRLGVGVCVGECVRERMRAGVCAKGAWWVGRGPCGRVTTGCNLSLLGGGGVMATDILKTFLAFLDFPLN